MKHNRALAAILFVSLVALSCGRSENYLDYVNPNIGTTHSRWFFYTPAAEPFGLAKLGASTDGSYGNPSGWEAVGYDDTHTSIDGFPCLHEFQVGGVALMPLVGDPKTEPGKLEEPDEGWRSRFDKADEQAHPGYYSVLLKDYGVRAELTATARVGFQRYTFPQSDQSHILFNIGNRQGESGSVKDAFVKVNGCVVEGFVSTEPEYVRVNQNGARVDMYFYAVLDKVPQSVQVFRQGGSLAEGTEISGPGAILCLGYATEEGERISVKVGLSYTSVENARLNLLAEASNLDFDGALAQTTDKWSRALGRIEVSGKSTDDKTKFYTGLYHALLGRGLASDVNGAYPKHDGGVGQIALGEDGRPIHNHYNTDAVWGAYWNLSLLWALAYPEYYADFIQSQLLVYDDSGWLGDGIANSKYVSGVGTNMTSILFAGAYQCGIEGFDVERAYAAALHNELGWENRPIGCGKADTKIFVERGFVPYDESRYFGTTPEGSMFSNSHTLEYSFSAYAVAQWAKALGKEEDYAKLSELSKGWEKVFDDSLALIRPRYANGDFIENFNPLESWRGFQEGNAMQYTFFVPEDPVGLVRRVGVEKFSERLDSIFTVARDLIFGGGKVTYAFSGLQSPYNHGNQPSLHISWLFNYSGKPWLTQKWTRLICNEFYGVTGEHGYGYGQDEDQGQLGAWYVMSALGLFDVQGGTSIDPTFQIGSPLFDKVEIYKGPKSKPFIIKTKGNGAEAYYVQSAKLNGRTLNNCWFHRSELKSGGSLKLIMGTEANEDWGADVPPAYSK